MFLYGREAIFLSSFEAFSVLKKSKKKRNEFHNLLDGALSNFSQMKLIACNYVLNRFSSKS